MDALMVLEGSVEALKLAGTNHAQDHETLVAWNERRCEVSIHDATSHERRRVAQAGHACAELLERGSMRRRFSAGPKEHEGRHLGPHDGEGADLPRAPLGHERNSRGERLVGGLGIYLEGFSLDLLERSLRLPLCRGRLGLGYLGVSLADSRVAAERDVVDRHIDVLHLTYPNPRLGIDP